MLKSAVMYYSLVLTTTQPLLLEKKRSMIPPYGMSLEIILPPTVPFTVKEFKLKDDMHNCVILCVAVTTKRLTV